MPRTRRVENLRHGARTTTAGTREGSTITVTASPHPYSGGETRGAHTQGFPHWGRDAGFDSKTNKISAGY